MEQEEVWDEIAPYWDEYKKKPFGKEDDKPKLVEDFITADDKKVLDLGCGSGRNFYKIKGVIYGVDFSAEMLKLAEKNAKKQGIKAVFNKAKTSKLPFEDNFFDKALFIATLHCVEGEKERKKSIQELYRVLKPRGKALITVWNKQSKRWKNKPKEKIVSWNAGGKKVMRYYYLYDFDELKKLLESVGFKVIWNNFTELARNIIVVVEK
ncbi:MAG: class I SAM-dependent methyltransferase [Candidatus Pacearchaeota archaeon]|jgi:ubiquinone/menaquinone biosynthesis C-methylase UbiE